MLAMTITQSDFLSRARKLHRRALVVDTHCDTTQRLADPDFDLALRHDDGHVDLPRMREGGIDAMFFAVYAPGPVQPGAGVRVALEQITRIQSAVQRHADTFTLARTADEVRAAKKSKRIALLVAIEGGYLIEDSLDNLREFRDRGATYLTLTHSFHTSWADSSGVHETLAPLHGGLTAFGRDVVRELNRLGMMVDISHASDDTFWDVLKVSTAPIIATHSSCRSVSPHRRNLSDDMIRAVADCDGVVQINFAAAFIDANHPPIDRDAILRWIADGGVTKKPLTDHVTPLSVLVDHFDRALQLVGPDHVGIGTDFDGVPSLPADMTDCSMLPNLTAALMQRGYSDGDLSKVLGENVLRVMDACAQIGEQPRSSNCAAVPTTPESR